VRSPCSWIHAGAISNGGPYRDPCSPPPRNPYPAINLIARGPLTSLAGRQGRRAASHPRRGCGLRNDLGTVSR